MPGRRHTREFREGAVTLVLEEKQSVTKVATDLGISPHTLYAWVGQAKKKRGTFTPQQDRDLAARVRELEAENRRLRTERDILKEATAFFAKEPS